MQFASLESFPMIKRIGNITIVGNANVWPHEMNTARALAKDGHDILFIDNGGKGTGSADVEMDGLAWEIKSPRADNIKAIERNVKRARNQSENVIIDSRRMKRVPDIAIQKALEKYCNEIKGIKHLIFVNRHGNVVLIK